MQTMGNDVDFCLFPECKFSVEPYVFRFFDLNCHKNLDLSVCDYKIFLYFDHSWCVLKADFFCYNNMKNKNMKNKIFDHLKIVFSLAVLLLSFLQPTALFFGNTPFAYAAVVPAAGIEVSVLDSVAGYGTVLRTSKVQPGSEVVFMVQQPNGNQLFFNSIADRNGAASYELNDYSTRVAGTYYASAEFKIFKRPGAPTTFRIFPDTVSPSRSSFESDSLIVRTGFGQKPKLNVTLTDAYGNSISGHEVRILSSRPSDLISAAPGRAITDSTGFSQFEIFSDNPGVSVFTAYDLTAEVVLERRIQIVFSNSPFLDSSLDSSLNSVGGDDELLAAADGLPDGLSDDAPDDISSDLTADSAVAPSATGNVVHTFEFEEIPEKIYKNEPVSLTVTTYDSEKNVVSSYTGKVHFSVISDNENAATLPEDYQFEEKDLGKHVFTLGFQFQQDGEYQLKVYDTANDKIFGEAKITVSGSKDSATPSAPSVKLTSPGNGKSGDNTQTLTGIGPAGKDIKFFDNNIEIGKIIAGVDSKFDFTTPALTDGQHVFYAAAVNEKGAILGTSDKVTVTIDATPPTITSITVDPNMDVSAGDPLQVSIISEENLTKASLSLEGILYDLTVDLEKPDTYSVAVPAPEVPGDYSFTVYLTDELGNEASYDNQGSFSVAGSGEPSEVSNLEAFPANGRVNLVWGAADDDNGVNHYRIYYGTSSENLDQQINTNSSNTTWYVPNLENGLSYYFQVAAVDTENQEGAPSPVLTAIPDASINPLFPASPNVMGETGPEVFWLFIPSAILARFVRRKRR